MITSILEKVQGNEVFVKDYLTPDEAFAINGIEQYENQNFLPFVDGEWSFKIFGGDCIGGIAYFGSKENIEKQIVSIKSYLLKIKDEHDAPFCFVWHTENGSMAILYEDYSRNTEVELIDGILSTKFGAWCDDDTLDIVICDIRQSIEYDFAFLGSEKINIKEKSGKIAIKQAKKIIKVVKTFRDSE
jgi:hypothetical protein